MIKETDLVQFLESYATDKKFITAQKYAKEFFDKTLSVDDTRLARMSAIENLITLLNPSDEYTLLHLHYIKGLSVEKCAECMGISRSTAFRLKKKAHIALCEKLTKKESNQDERN